MTMFLCHIHIYLTLFSPIRDKVARMVHQSADYQDVLDKLLEQLADSGASLFPRCREEVSATARRILTQTELHYMPSYKITELLADLVNLAASISSEGWLSQEESVAQWHRCTASTSTLVQSFLSEARMEKARYEPIMLADRHRTPRSERNAILRLRLKRMLDARQTYAPLPSSFVRAVRMAGDRAIHAECFSTYRIGPMLQMFADMIRHANQVSDQTFDEFAGLESLSYLLREEGTLWKLYRHKAPRFRAKPDDPLHADVFVTRANVLYVPDRPGRPTLH